MALDLPRAHLIEVLSSGHIQLTGKFIWGSNHTFLADVSADQLELQAVYKPAAGERPLWDFPPQSLAQREVAAYLTSQALGWKLVPPTVLRFDGPAGGGSLQLYLDIDPERHYFSFNAQERERLAPAALFDVLINNADRKAGHVLMAPDGHIWLIDHGVCFHRDYKLRTVIWDFADRAIPTDLLQDLAAFRSALEAAEGATSSGAATGLEPSPAPSAAALPPAARLAHMLSPAEFAALKGRARQLMLTKRYPVPGSERHYPWPLI